MTARHLQPVAPVFRSEPGPELVKLPAGYRVWPARRAWGLAADLAFMAAAFAFVAWLDWRDRRRGWKP